MSVSLKMPTALEFSTPKQLGNSRFYTQVIWDEDKKKGFIAVLEKNKDRTFKRCSSALVKTIMESMKKTAALD